MDLFNKFAGQHGQQQHPDQANQQSSGGGGFMGLLNNAAGGGKAGEAKEDGLDKAIDYVQEHVLGQGNQSNESALEQAKDEQISDFIRSQYKGATGKDFPIADK
ncbi:unnamed protein product [Rhizoctonia solani]|uniref:DNA damage-responsive protein 48 n=1 Tax=Rhizoctonia solani TaxID=456999 RepID=A0A8H3HJA8_9AGAM|nr:unnamed protein product [Rhizoctonia solani]